MKYTCAHHEQLRIYTFSSTTMATHQKNAPEFKLVLVGDGGVGMLNNSFRFDLHIMMNVFLR